MSTIKHSRFAGAMLASLCVSTLTACGGGNGDGPRLSPPATQRATVGILITDAPAGDFDQVNATITRIELLGNDGRETIFSGEETIDLLALSHFSELFAVGLVEPGSFEKIRLTLGDLELVRLDDAGNLIEAIHPRLPGNGKLDLNPRGGFDVLPRSTLIVEIDIDAEKSIHIVNAGGRDQVNFRPVVFVNVVDGDFSGRLARIHGRIESIDAAAASFVLCQTRLVAGGGSAGESGHCIDVFTDDATGIFAPSGAPAAFADLMPDDAVTAVGFLRSLEDGRDDRVFALDAVVVEIGPLGSFARLRGVAAGPVDAATDRFDFDVDAGQGFPDATTLLTRLQTGTRIFSRSGDELAADAIQTGVAAEVDGIVTLSDVAADTLAAALIVIDLAADDVEEMLSGTLMARDGAQLIVATDGADVCVKTTGETNIFIVSTAGDAFESRRAELDELASGQRVDIFGLFGIDGCFIAATILAEASSGGAAARSVE